MGSFSYLTGQIICITMLNTYFTGKLLNLLVKINHVLFSMANQAILTTDIHVNGCLWTCVHLSQAHSARSIYPEICDFHTIN